MLKHIFIFLSLFTSATAQQLSAQDVFAKAKAHLGSDKALKAAQSFPGLKKWEARQLMPPPATIESATVKMDATQKFEIAMKMQIEQRPPEVKHDFKMRDTISSFDKKEFILNYNPQQQEVNRFEQVKLFEIANLKPLEITIRYGADNSKKGLEMLQFLQLRAKIITAYLPKSTIIKEYFEPEMAANSVKIEY